MGVLSFPCFVPFDLLMRPVSVIPINVLNNYNTVSRFFFFFFFFFKFINWDPILLFKQILRSLNDNYHFQTKLK